MFAQEEDLIGHAPSLFLHVSCLDLCFGEHLLEEKGEIIEGQVFDPQVFLHIGKGILAAEVEATLLLFALGEGFGGLFEAAVVEELVDDFEAWIGLEFLKECFHGARFNMRAVLLAAPLIRPGKTQREVFDEIVPRMLENVAEQGRDSGYTDDQVTLYVDAHERAYRALAGEFGFVDMTEDEIRSLAEF